MTFSGHDDSTINIVLGLLLLLLFVSPTKSPDVAWLVVTEKVDVVVTIFSCFISRLHIFSPRARV